ncbi:16S rRNA (cytosine(1402)-N(4))-methyltransferase RsmH [Magnetovibrio blakemorei]|uniref:Ribosomal RNA small subunit methyltransferase H n=1 Tax=Magnetovibrio blakemorei TaxID=28181 RepID=A0A1E5Q8W2_9PROT|nr:16S rRNA (cytosine(1402)-N(4))-methyltransferase RsmH [Magnetovibrio blakemorei]OEJ67900.1 16S rRNA (cytosine(1402)-N(4))-methyltransferase [Magnetovibrio blakemorei]
MSMPHIPVLLKEVLDTLNPRDGGVYVDGTFGNGGYSRALLESCDCAVWGIDRDPNVIAKAQDMQAEFCGRLNVVEGRFGDMFDLLSAQGVSGVDGVALDLGVSSMQLDQAERGFSFMTDGPLDMRMEQSGPTAADAVNGLGEEELANIIYEFGEERRSRWVARAIIEARAEGEITRTKQLAEIVRKVVKKAKDGIHPATRTFQGLRIYVNDELGEVDRGLSGAEHLLGAGGRLAVVSFHSLEDKRVKGFLNARSGNMPNPSRHIPDTSGDGPAPTFKLLKKGTVKPTAEECKINPRSRSSRLRMAERTDAPAWPFSKRSAA